MKKSERKWDPHLSPHTLHIYELSTEININTCEPDGWKENILTFPKKYGRRRTIECSGVFEWCPRLDWIS